MSGGDTETSGSVTMLSAPETDSACCKKALPITAMRTSSAAVASFSINVRTALPSDHGAWPGHPRSMIPDLTLEAALRLSMSDMQKNQAISYRPRIFVYPQRGILVTADCHLHLRSVFGGAASTNDVNLHTVMGGRPDGSICSLRNY